jgi:3-oxoacyl-[acyl-carrier-protein] synthase III
LDKFGLRKDEFGREHFRRFFDQFARVVVATLQLATLKEKDIGEVMFKTENFFFIGKIPRPSSGWFLPKY